MKKNIILLGYMGCGKSLIASKLSEILEIEMLDLDQYIEEKEQLPIPKLFKQKGEIYFRKQEETYLKEVLLQPKVKILSLGGGTPCFGNNMETIKKAPNSCSIYLYASLKTLTERLFNEKAKRPLIQHIETKEALEDFIRKHLFERNFYYRQADIVIETNGKTPEEIVLEIRESLL